MEGTVLRLVSSVAPARFLFRLKPRPAFPRCASLAKKSACCYGRGPLGPIHQNPQDTVWSGDLSLRYRAAPGGRADVFACGARVSDAKHSGTLAVWRRRHAGGYGDDSFL